MRLRFRYDLCPMTRPLRADAERNRRKLLDAAAELFARKGLSVGLDEIARHAGVGVGTAYRRFPDKEQLIEALFEDRVEQVVALAERAAERDDAWEGLVEFVTGNVELQSSDQGLKELVFGSPHGRARVESARARIMPAAGRLVARAQAAGELRGDIAQTDVALTVFMLTGLADLTRGTRPDVWRRHLRIVLDGLRTPEPGEMPAAPLSPDALEEVIAALPAGTPRRRSG
jgi:AcrR family transcriptional regulator